MKNSAIDYIIGLPLIAGMLGLSWLGVAESHKRLDDQEDLRTIYLDQLPSISKLAEGPCKVVIYRQSGYVHAAYDHVPSAVEALKIVMATLRRAKIDAVNVRINTETMLSFGRLYHDHRGRAEGKKVGRAEIVRVN